MNQLIIFLSKFFKISLAFENASKHSVTIPDILTVSQFLARKYQKATKLAPNFFSLLLEQYVYLIFSETANKLKSSIMKEKGRNGLYFTNVIFLIDPLQKLADELRTVDQNPDDEFLANRINYHFAKSVFVLRTKFNIDLIAILAPEAEQVSNEELQEIIQKYEKSNGKDRYIQRPNFQTTFEDFKDLGSSQDDEILQDEDEDDDEYEEDQELTEEDELVDIDNQLIQIKSNRQMISNKAKGDETDKKIKDALESNDLVKKRSTVGSSRISLSLLRTNARKRGDKKKQAKSKKKTESKKN